MKACYSINRKAAYVTIYNTGTIYPLDVWNEFKAQHDMTHQEVADLLLRQEYYEQPWKDPENRDGTYNDFINERMRGDQESAVRRGSGNGEGFLRSKQAE